MITSKSPRVEVVDAIRGIAVAMILMLHSIEHFNFYEFTTPESPWLRLTDQMIWDSLWFTIGGKAYAIFALLFGFSFHIMLSNARRQGCGFRARFVWRMILLFLFGNLNAAFFCGEVLVLYSIVGLIMPFVCNLRTRTVLILAAICMLQPVEWIKMGYAAVHPDAPSILTFDYGSHWGNAMNALREGNFLDTLRANLWDGQIFSLAWAWGAGRFFQTASLFMIGMVAGRLRWFAETRENRRLWARVLAVSLILFFSLSGLNALIPQFAGGLSEDADTVLTILRQGTFCGPMMSVIGSLKNCAFMFVLVTGMLFAFYGTRLQGVMRRIMPYGRMSLTNYVMQSMIGSFLFYNWGLHLQLCHTWSEMLGLSVLVVQIFFCRWWMARHRRGPLEEIWSRLTWLKM
ncbi:MAG: DUF418 domain-containing protein [Bacteroidaceae bacterium]